MQEPHDMGSNRPPTLRLASFAATSLGGLLVGLGSLLDWATVAPHIPGATGTALNSDIPASTSPRARSRSSSASRSW
jgi:hypothetical protein